MKFCVSGAKIWLSTMNHEIVCPLTVQQCALFKTNALMIIIFLSIYLFLSFRYLRNLFKMMYMSSGRLTCACAAGMCLKHFFDDGNMTWMDTDRRFFKMRQ